MRFALTLLCFAFTINADQIHGPFEPGPVDRAAAIAVAPHGMLMAWSEIDPGATVAVIHTALLDFDARRVGPIHRLPTHGQRMHATRPAIATDGTNFFVAWVERDRYGDTPRVVAGLLTDGAGKPLQQPSWLGDPVRGAPSLVWNGLEYRLYSSNTYRISTAGEVSLYEWGEVSQRLPFANPMANGWLDWSNEPGRLFVAPVYILDWAIISRNFIRSGQIRERGYNGFAAAVAVDGDDLLFVWGGPRGLKAARVIDGETGRIFERDDPRAVLATPALAGSLVVFDQLGDIYGAFIDGDAIGETFPISEGEEWDSAPRVYITGEGRYLVTFVREGDGPDIHLMNNFVTGRN